MSLSGLQDLFGTLTVGLLCLFLAIEAYHLAFAIEVEEGTVAHRKSPLLLHGLRKVALPAVLLLGVFMIGTVAETITDQLVDSNRGKQPSWPPSLHSETYFRIGTLFKDLGSLPCSFDEKEEVRQKLNLDSTVIGRVVLTNKKYLSKVPLSGELSYIKVLTDEANRVEQKFAEAIVNGKEGAKVQREALQLSVPCETLGRSVDALYYAAKNWSYTIDNYFNELQAIQRRIDFLRSIYLVLGWFGPLVLLGGIIGAWRERAWSPWPSIYRTLRVLGGVVLLSLASHYGWARAEINFNERAWGYFLTELDLNGNSPSKKDSSSKENSPCKHDENTSDPKQQADG